MNQNYEEKLEWQGMPVLTTRMLAERLGVPEVNIRMGFSKNKDKYIEGQDFYFLSGGELRKFKSIIRREKVNYYLSPKTRNLILWTVKGVYNHAKTCSTEQAWRAFLSLKNKYFIQKSRIKELTEKSNRLIYTYIMLDNNTGYYKIGKSVNPEFREKTLQSQKPTIELLFQSPQNIEKDLHKLFSDKRIRGEWFELSASDLDSIKTKYNINYHE